MLVSIIHDGVRQILVVCDIEGMKKIQKEIIVVLRKAQKEIKQQANKKKKKAMKWKKRNKVMLSTKDLVFKKRLVKKLVD